MRLSHLLPVSLLSFAIAQADHVQLPFETETVHTQRITLTDVLSSNSNYSSLLKLLQRSRLIPTLNRLSNATLFAPTNAALNATDLEQYAKGDAMLADNIQAALRRQLLYHLLNYTLPLPAAETEPSSHLIETLLFPHPKAGLGKPGDPPDSGDVRDEHSLLGGEGQKLRMTVAKGVNDSFTLSANQDTATVSVTQQQRADNGIVLPIDALLHPPKSMKDVLFHHPSLSQIRSLYTREQLEEYATKPNLTLFVPIDEAWEGDALDELEWRYLRSGFAEKDLMELFQNHALDTKIGYADRLREEKSVTTIAGHELSINMSGSGIHLNSSKIIRADILASNGVVHLIDRLLLPEGSLALTPEKYLLALNCTRFVSLLRSTNLSSLVQSNEPLTILAPSDQVIDAFEQRQWTALPQPGSQELTDLLRYHFIQGKWTYDQLDDGMLLDSKLATTSLKHQNQKVPVSVDKDPTLKKSKNTISFANANTLGAPIEIGSSIVYLLSQVLEPPSDVLQTAMSDLRLSTFVAGIYAGELDKQLKSAPAITFVAPVNAAFSALGLTMSYLLLPSSKVELVSMMRYHAIDRIAYLRDLRSESRLSTLNGSPLYVDSVGQGISLRGPTLSGFPASGQLQNSNITDGDVLTSTGVLHVLDQALLPPTIDISIEKLLKGARASTMVDLLRSANMTWILRGERAPENFTISKKPKWRRRKRKHAAASTELPSYTLLCPLDRAFNRINLTYYLEDKAALVDLLKLHIIPADAVFPSDGRPLTLEDKITYDTLLSENKGGPSQYGKLAFRNFGDDAYLVGIQNARGASLQNDWARILSFGRTTPRFSRAASSLNDPLKILSAGGVFTLDTVLVPYEPDWFHRFGWIIVVVLLGIVGLAVVALLGVKLYRSKKHHEYTALDGEED